MLCFGENEEGTGSTVSIVLCLEYDSRNVTLVVFFKKETEEKVFFGCPRSSRTCGGKAECYLQGCNTMESLQFSTVNIREI